eukprot:1160405-Pelagomonas_calceolata.AAC.1
MANIPHDMLRQFQMHASHREHAKLATAVLLPNYYHCKNERSEKTQRLVRYRTSAISLRGNPVQGVTKGQPGYP